MTQPPTKSAAYRADIQGLRAVASILVATYHIWFGRVSGGVTYEQAADAVLDPTLRATRNAVEARLRKAAEDAARDKAGSALRDRLEKSLERKN